MRTLQHSFRIRHLSGVGTFLLFALSAVPRAAKAGFGDGKRHIREHRAAVALEAQGLLEDVSTFHELEEKTHLEGECRLVGPCAWQMSFTPKDVSVIAPEPHVIYHYSVWTMGQNDTAVYRIRGQFPKVRYFSIQTYTMQRQPIDVKADFELIPSSGINPFLTPPGPVEAGANGIYEVYITAQGNHGYPNELKAYHSDRLLTRLHGGRETTWGRFLLAIRLYASDPSTDQSILWGTGPSLFGFVPPPSVEWKRNNGPFQEIRQCTPREQHCNTNILDDLMSFPQFLLPIRDFAGFNCPLAENDRVNSDFYLWSAKMPPIVDAYIGFKNSDVTYFYWCDIANRLGRDNFVLKISGTLASTPKGLYDEPLIARADHYDARYASFHAIDLRPPIPSYSAIYDGELWSHYGRDWDRRYSIVSAVNPSAAKACGLFDDRADVFLPFSRADGNMTSRNVAVPAIVYREILPSIVRLKRPGKSPSDVAAACGLNDARGSVPVSAYDALSQPSLSRTRRQAQHPNCESPDFARSIMQERYPEIAVYQCDARTGIATLLA